LTVTSHDTQGPREGAGEKPTSKKVVFGDLEGELLSFLAITPIYYHSGGFNLAPTFDWEKSGEKDAKRAKKDNRAKKDAKRDKKDKRSERERESDSSGSGSGSSDVSE
jgi:hypothetical protein